MRNIIYRNPQHRGRQKGAITMFSAVLILILLTDGANTAGQVSPLKAAELAADQGLKIYTIGIGADEMMVVLLLPVVDNAEVQVRQRVIVVQFDRPGKILKCQPKLVSFEVDACQARIRAWAVGCTGNTVFPKGFRVCPDLVALDCPDGKKRG